MLTTDIRSPYVDYKYYHESYHGDLISAEDFKQAEKEAEAYVDAITFGRIRKLDEIPECVMDAICSASEDMHRYLEGRLTQAKSESNDGYSITYADAVTDTKCQSSMLIAARRHLANTGLMYKGWSKKYDK